MEHEPVSPSQGGQNEPGMVRPWLLVVLIIIVLAGIIFFAWSIYQNQKLAGAKTKPNPGISMPL